MMILRRIFLVCVCLFSLISIFGRTYRVGDYVECYISDPSNVKTNSEKWSSNNRGELIAGNYRKATFKAVQKGTLSVHCSYITKSNAVKTETWSFTIEPLSPDYVSIIPTEDIEMNVGESITLDTKLYPTLSETDSYMWNTADPTILSLGDYKYHNTTITALNAGNTTVSVSVPGCSVATRKVKVYGNNPTSVIIPATKDMYVGDTEQVIASFIPADTRTSLTWTSSNKTIATISTDGTINAISPGTTIITAETTNHVYANMQITVKEIPIKLVSTSPTNKSISVDVLTVPIISFNQNIQLKDTDHAVTLLKSTRENIACEMSCIDHDIKCFPQKALAPNTTYTLFIPKDFIINEWGTGYKQDISLSFTTGSLRKLEISASEASGSFLWEGSKVSLNASEENALIYYTLDGTRPSKDSHLYQGPIAIKQDVVIWAIAILDGYEVAEIKNEYKLALLKRVDWFPTNQFTYSFKDHLYTYKDVNPYVEFSLDIAKGENFNEICLKDESGENVQGRTILHGNRLVFVPERSLEEGKIYQISIPANAIRATNGQTNSIDLGWKFETGFSVVDFSAGFRHALLVKDNHDMHEWGYQINNGNEYWNDTANQHSYSGCSKVSAGYTHNMALREDGNLYAFGNQYCGEMGWNSFADARWPIKINFNCDDIFCGGQNTAVLKNGTLYMAGRNDFHQIDDYDDIYGDCFPGFTKIALSNIVKVVPSLENTFMLTTDGNLYGMGNSLNQLLYDPYKSFYNYSLIISGIKDFSACKWASTNIAIITEDNRLLMWGSNKYGLLGDGNDVDYQNPKEILSDVKSVSLGIDCAAAIKNDGTLWMWGRNSHNQLSDKINGDTNIPQQIMEHVTRVDIGDHYVLVLKEDGSLWSWGCNQYAQLGRQLDGPFRQNEDIDSPTPGLVMTGREWTPISGLTLKDKQFNLLVGEQAVAIGQTIPLKTNYQEWRWTIDNTEVATVNERGIITAKAIGSTTLTLHTDNGLTASCSICVNDATGISNITQDKTAFDVYDLQGRKILSKVKTTKGLKHGVYIINGKKIDLSK